MTSVRIGSREERSQRHGAHGKLHNLWVYPLKKKAFFKVFCFVIFSSLFFTAMLLISWEY